MFGFVGIPAELNQLSLIPGIHGSSVITRSCCHFRINVWIRAIWQLLASRSSRLSPESFGYPDATLDKYSASMATSPSSA